jgi:hypothetical protein
MTDPTLTLKRGQAARAAMLFGNAQVLLQAGHAFGQNIVTGFGEVPTRDLDPIYIRMAGIEAAFLMDGASYAWDSNGLVVSADLSLSGVTGYTGASAPSSSWVRLPVASTGLNPTPVPDTDVTVKANSIAIPAGFNPRDPASVAAALAALPTNGSDRYAVSQPDDLLLIIPVLESESVEVMTGGFISAIEYEYVLTLPAETFELATGGVVEVFAGGVVPAAEVTVAALVPGVSTGASVGVPAAGVAVVAVPPVVAAGISVTLPAAGVAVAALAPTVTAGAVGDPDFANVSLLLNMDGSNGSTTFTDSSSNGLTVTAYGGAQLTTADKKYGTAAAVFDGADGTYIQTATSSELVLGTGDFTIEMWLKPDTVSGNDGVFTFGIAGPSLSLYLGDWWLSQAGVGGSGNIDNMGAASAGIWQHIAIARSGTTVRFFVDGAQLGSDRTWNNNFTHNQIDIGRYGLSFGTIYVYDGLIDEFRITKGIARYTANFTPPTAPFPDA